MNSLPQGHGPSQVPDDPDHPLPLPANVYQAAGRFLRSVLPHEEFVRRAVAMHQRKKAAARDDPAYQRQLRQSIARDRVALVLLEQGCVFHHDGDAEETFHGEFDELRELPQAERECLQRHALAALRRMDETTVSRALIKVATKLEADISDLRRLNFTPNDARLAHEMVASAVRRLFHELDGTHDRPGQRLPDPMEAQ